MTNDQLQFIEDSVKKHPLLFHSFIIAKTNREVLKSLQNSPNKNHFNSVLFHIEINEIGKQFEKFILFPIKTHFKIISIDYQNQISIVKIVVSNFNSSLSKKQTNPFELAYSLRNLGRLDDKEKIFHRLFSQYPAHNSHLYNELARIYQDKGLYQTSLQFYEKSLVTVSLKDRPYYLNNIGCIYDYLQQYDLALQFYSTALTLMKNETDRAMCRNNIAIPVANQQQYEQAFQSFQQSLTIREKFLLENHPDLCISLANMGALYSSINQFDLALEHYQRALKIFSHNSSLLYKAIVYQNMGEVFINKNQLNEALNYYQQAATIFRQIRPSYNHPTLIYIEQILNQLNQIK